MNILKGQIVALLKNIHLQEPVNGEAGKCEFIGNDYPGRIGGLVVSWWQTERTLKITENISFVIIRDFEKFSACDPDSIQEIVSSTIQKISMNAEYFDCDYVFFKRKENLFLCRSNDDVGSFSLSVVEKIIENISMNISYWCTAYVAPRLIGSSFSIASEKIHVIGREDTFAWNELVRNKYKTNDFDPVAGVFNGDKSLPFANKKYDYIFVCEEIGTSDGSKFNASLKLKMLFSIIISFSKKKNSMPLFKSSAQPYSYCVQFPDREAQALSCKYSHIGKMLPYYVSDYCISDEEISEILDWYASVASLELEKTNRVVKSAHYINHALNSSDIESYINYFISLDALFGKRGSVEKSIEDGIAGLNIPSKEKEKISWLFNLRNELVHGGSRHTKEWSDYYRYYRHFGSEPQHDIENLAMIALRQFPTL